MLSGEESQQPTWPQVRHIRRCTQALPSATQSSHCPSVRGSTGGRTSLRWSQSPTSGAGMPVPPASVRARPGSSRASTPRCRASRAPARRPRGRPCRCCGSPGHAPFGVDHQLAAPGVDLARRLLDARADPLPGRVVASPDPVTDRVADVVRVLLLEQVELSQTGLGGLVQQVGARQRVGRRVGRGHPQPPGQPRQGQALDEQGAGGDGERDQQEYVAMRGVPGMTKAAARVTTPRIPAQPSRGCRSTEAPAAARRDRDAPGGSGR